MTVISPINTHCSIARSLAVLGEKWALLIVRDVRMGVTRFSDMRARQGMAADVLADRLAKLVALGVLERRPYHDDGARVREEYVLTPAGEELSWVLGALQCWGDRHLSADSESSSRFVSADTGEGVRVGFIGEDGTELSLDQVSIVSPAL